MVQWQYDKTPGECRAALIEHGAVVELHLSRFNQLALGSRGTARLISRSVSGAFLKTDTGADLLMRERLIQTEGAYLPYVITREAIAEPGGLKIAEARTDAVGVADSASEPDIGRGQQSIDVDAIIDLAMAGESIAGPARIAFQRTKAGLVFDVDGDGDAHIVNLAAATEIARLLRLFQVAGSALIDFVSMNSKEARQLVAEAFDAASADDPRAFERTAINGFGLMQVVRQKTRPSLLDHIFGVNILSPSIETQALWVLRDTWNSQGIGVRRIITLERIADQLNNPVWQPLIDECARHVGACVEIIVDSTTRGYGNVHVQPA